METAKQRVKRRAGYAGPRGVLAYMKSSETNCSVETLLELDSEEDEENNQGLHEPEETSNSAKHLCNKDKPSGELIRKGVERPPASKKSASIALDKSDDTDQPLTTHETVPNGKQKSSKHGVGQNGEYASMGFGGAEISLTSCCLEKSKNTGTRDKIIESIPPDSQSQLGKFQTQKNTEILPFIELAEIRSVNEYSEKYKFKCTGETQNTEKIVNKSNNVFEERKVPEITINDNSEGYTYKVKTPVYDDTINTKPKPNTKNIVDTQDSSGHKNKENRETFNVPVQRRSSFLDRIFRTKKQAIQTNKPNDKKTLRTTSPQRRFLGLPFGKLSNKKDDSTSSGKSGLSK
ncbi:uncharacterized protein LOC106472340, partial [Limulus polyphemus]|uniref:Uncharacterized protein LOC106472340 n=1 Tax=Limulus polyphemus TaxID=6850 RepID=A0ABM1BTM5_LIMPO